MLKNTYKISESGAAEILILESKHLKRCPCDLLGAADNQNALRALAQRALSIRCLDEFTDSEAATTQWQAAWQFLSNLERLDWTTHTFTLERSQHPATQSLHMGMPPSIQEMVLYFTWPSSDPLEPDEVFYLDWMEFHGYAPALTDLNFKCLHEGGNKLLGRRLFLATEQDLPSLTLLAGDAHSITGRLYPSNLTHLVLKLSNSLQ